MHVFPQASEHLDDRPVYSLLRGVLPKSVGACGDAVRVFAIDGVERVKQRLRFGFKAEQEGGAEDAGEAEVVVVHRPEPVLRALAEVGQALDCASSCCGNPGESVEAQHAFEGLAQAVAHGSRCVEGLDGRGVKGRRSGVGAAALGEGKEPLDEVVDVFEAVVGPGEDFGQSAAPVVTRTIAIEGDQRRWRGVRQMRGGPFVDYSASIGDKLHSTRSG